MPLDEELVSCPDIRLIKVDVEGAEQRVLQGAQAIIARQRPPFIIAELHPFALEQFGYSQQSLRKLMYDCGYETFLINGTDAPPVLVPAGSRIELWHIINLLFATPASIAECWPVFYVGAAKPS